MFDEENEKNWEEMNELDIARTMRLEQDFFESNDLIEEDDDPDAPWWPEEDRDDDYEGEYDYRDYYSF
jgi:hypothetical protein